MKSARAILLFAGAVFVTVSGAIGRAHANPPNILIIIGDDMGYADVGFHGGKDIPTPNLDAIAASGVRFSNGYVTGPYCSPTRAGLLTGRYQNRFGHEFNPSGGQQGLPVTEVTIADRLKSAGYVTSLIGKWHLGSNPSMHPLQRGFTEFYGFAGGAHDYFDSSGIQRGTTPVTDFEYATDTFGDEAISFIERQNERPWFLCLSFNAVHTPMQAKQEDLERFAGVSDPVRQTYNAMMYSMDQAIGRVHTKITESGLAGNTLVMFISDNGGPTMPGVTVNGSSNLPLRGSKRTTLEGGIRVPFIVSWPGHLKPGVFESPVIQLDLHATALAAAGVETRSEWKLDGMNLLPHLSGENTNAPHDALFWRFGAQMAIRAGDYKLVRYDINADTLTGKRQQGVTKPKLYNLAADLGETTDLADTLPNKVTELQAKWDTWNADNIEPLWGGGNSEGAPGRRKNKPPQD